MKKNTSKQDIARQSIIFATTIAFVINNHGKGRKMREKSQGEVPSPIENISYKPNQVAQSSGNGIVFTRKEINIGKARTSIKLFMGKHEGAVFHANVCVNKYLKGNR